MTYLPRTLACVLGQDVLPATILVLHADARFDGSRGWVIPFTFGGGQVSVDVREEPRCTSFGTQVSYALGHGRIPAGCSLLWLLHDDSRPAGPRVLGRLLEAYRKAPKASIVGTKQLDWQGDGLQDVGWLLDRHGRRASLVLDGEQDQSQYDNRQDMLAVSLAGALVSKEAWRQAGGVDPWMGTFGESTDLCRRVWRLGRRVIVLPQAATRHVRARYAGLRSADGSHRRGQPRSTTMARLRAQEKIALTNTHALMLLPAWLWSVVRALVLFVVELFRKRPALAFDMLALPWLRLAYLPRRLSPSRFYSRTGIDTRHYPTLVATSAQMRDWRVRRRAFAAQDGGEPLNPLARAHLRHLAHGRVFDCVVLALLGLAAMIAVSWPFLSVLFGGGSLVSSRLAPTAATAAQTFEAGTLMWTRALGIGAVGAPLPFDLFLGLLALVGGGRLSVGITIFWLLALPCAMLSMYAVAGAVTRSRPLRMVASLAWGAAAFLFGVVQTAGLPLLVVAVFLPLSFYFVFRAVGWYAVDEPHSPHPSVQAAAVAGLLLALVVLAEPQLILPLVLAFLLYLLVVKEHKAMLLLMPVPAIVALAPTFYYVLFRAREGAWRQLFADALVPDRAVSDMSVLVRRYLGAGSLPQAAGRIGLISLAVVGVVLVLAAVFSLFVRSARRMSRMAWTLVFSGALLLVLAPRVGISPSTTAGQGPVTGSCVPALMVVLFGLLLAASALTGMNDSLFRMVVFGDGAGTAAQDAAVAANTAAAPADTVTGVRSEPVAVGPDGQVRLHTLASRRTPLAGLRALLCVVLTCGVVLVGVLSGLAWKGTSTVGASRQALPIVAVNDLHSGKSRILAVRADGRDSLRYWVMGTGSGDLIDVSPMASAWSLTHTDPSEEAVSQAAAGLLAGSGQVASQLAALGFIGIYVPPATVSSDTTVRQARTSLISHILSADGTVQVTNTAEDGLYVRLQEAGGICRTGSTGSSAGASSASGSSASVVEDQTGAESVGDDDGTDVSASSTQTQSGSCAVQKRTDSAYSAAQTDPQRLIWLVLLCLVLLIYLIVAIPRSRHLSTEGGR